MDRFILVALPRTGSTLTAEMLNSHFSVHCDQQIFSPRWRDNPKKPELFFRKLYPVMYAKKRSANYRNLVYGFKLIFNEIFFLDKAISEFHQEGWKLIIIDRSNYLKQAISLMIARKQKHWHKRSINPASSIVRIHLETTKLLDEIERLEKATKWIKSVVNPYTHLSINYECDLQDKEKQIATFSRLCDYLSISRINPDSNLQRIHSEPIGNYIENYSEIIEKLSGTKYKIFCEEL